MESQTREDSNLYEVPRYYERRGTEDQTYVELYDGKVYEPSIEYVPMNRRRLPEEKELR